jgi:glutamyl-tRNA(Gln) amidotransferase subunit E
VGTKPEIETIQTIDYADVGLIAGLEVHQQLLTGRKMFCHCPAGLYTTQHDGEVLRHMRPTLSELGEYDGTALMEFKTRKNIIYLLHRDNVCTYEMDDTPPFLMNQEALDVAVEQCLMLGCDIVDEVHVARKQYLVVSIPTGFQRTAIVGVNGRLPFQGRELTITQVSVEEDSCREVSDMGHLIVWRTDRLGMPLIETVTGPDLRTPDEVAEAILLIGRVCRSTGHVRVGIGASRQDVNVSVRGGRRVEIKGVPQAWWARKLVHGEAIRQVNLLKLRTELQHHHIKKAEDFKITHTDITDYCRTSKLPFLRPENWERFVSETNRTPGLELGEGSFSVRAVKLTGLKDTLTWPTQPGRAFIDEIKGRVRVIAGLDQRPIVLNSEDWPGYENSQLELEAIRQRIECGRNDAFIVVWGPQQDTLTAANEIRIRYEDALDGIPNETRQPFVDGSTDFERILPGPDRMYPDTDHPPIGMTRDRVKRLEAGLPALPWEREKQYGAAGVPRTTIYYLIRRNAAALVDLVVEKCDADLRRACFFFGEKLKGFRRRGIAVDAITPERWCEFFKIVAERPALWEAGKQLVTFMADTPGDSADKSLKKAGLDNNPSGWKKLVDETVQTCQPDHPVDTPGKLHRFYMGQVMSKLRGKVAAIEVSRVLTKKLKSIT